MGYHNPNPESETKMELNQQHDTRQKINTQDKPMISMLINSIQYFIDCVFILQTKDKFRLVALHQSRILCDNYYSTSRGCRIAFDKMFKNKAWREGIKAEWSHFYDPDKLWLEKKSSSLKS